MTGEQTPGTNLRRSHINVFLTSLGQHVPLKVNVGFAKVWRTNFWRRCPFHVKEFRTTLIYIIFFRSIIEYTYFNIDDVHAHKYGRLIKRKRAAQHILLLYNAFYRDLSPFQGSADGQQTAAHSTLCSRIDSLSVSVSGVSSRKCRSMSSCP